MDIGTLRGIMTAILIVAFVGICVWAYSGRRRERFESAAQLPLEEDAPIVRRAKH